MRTPKPYPLEVTETNRVPAVQERKLNIVVNMKWIKASERLPEVEGEYYIKDRIGDERLMYFKAEYKKLWISLVDEWVDESEPVVNPENPFNDDEYSVMASLFKANDCFKKIANGTELMKEWNQKFHELQNILIVKSTIRKYPNYFNQ